MSRGKLIGIVAAVVAGVGIGAFVIFNQEEPAIDLTADEAEATPATTLTTEQATEAQGPECVPISGPGQSASGYFSAFSNEVVDSQNSGVFGDTFVISNSVGLSFSDSGGPITGTMAVIYQIDDLVSIGIAMSPRPPQVVYDPATGELRGIVNVTQGDGNEFTELTGQLTGTVDPASETFSGRIEHPDLDLSFQGTITPTTYSYFEDPACYATLTEQDNP